MEAVSPERADPEYAVRLGLLRARIAERPAARLAVVIGSSRTAHGFAPESLPDDPAMLWFNLSHPGAGPVFNRLTLDRLHRDGIHPDRVVIEVMPTFFEKEHPRFLGPNLTTGELATAAKYLPAKPLAGKWFTHRFGRPGNLRQVFAPEATGVASFRPCGGAVCLEAATPPDERARRIAGQCILHGTAARNLTVHPGPDRALRDTLRLCRDRGIEPVLLLTPEGPAFRGWYDADGWQHFAAYVRSVAGEYGVPWIDARDWLSEDDFADSHHPLRHAAEAFTARLIREMPEAIRR